MSSITTSPTSNSGARKSTCKWTGDIQWIDRLNYQLIISSSFFSKRIAGWLPQELQKRGGMTGKDLLLLAVPISNRRLREFLISFHGNDTSIWWIGLCRWFLRIWSSDDIFGFRQKIKRDGSLLCHFHFSLNVKWGKGCRHDGFARLAIFGKKWPRRETGTPCVSNNKAACICVCKARVNPYTAGRIDHDIHGVTLSLYFQKEKNKKRTCPGYTCEKKPRNDVYVSVCRSLGPPDKFPLISIRFQSNCATPSCKKGS